MPILSAALRTSSSLTHLSLSRVGLLNRLAGLELFDALVGHPMLETITLNDMVGAEMRALAGAALGRLVEANAPALKKLNVSNCALGDDGLRPLFAALPSSKYLTFLYAQFNGISAAFAPVVLASVTANGSLLLLSMDGRKQNESDPGHGEVSIAELREAEALVRRRGWSRRG